MGVEIDLVVVEGINLVLVSGHQNYLEFIVWIEIDLTSGLGSELTWFLRGFPKYVVLVCRNYNLVFVWGSI